jgi:hypothetical protein
MLTHVAIQPQPSHTTLPLWIEDFNGLVDLVLLVCLVYMVYLVISLYETNQKNQINHIDKTNRNTQADYQY